jgi:hypothetical protein
MVFFVLGESSNKIQTLGNCPKEGMRNSEEGEILK